MKKWSDTINLEISIIFVPKIVHYPLKVLQHLIIERRHSTHPKIFRPWTVGTDSSQAAQFDLSLWIIQTAINSSEHVLWNFWRRFRQRKKNVTDPQFQNWLIRIDKLENLDDKICLRFYYCQFSWPNVVAKIYL